MDKLVDRNLPPLEQMEQIEEAVENQSDSDWLKPWILEIHAEGYKEGYAEGCKEGYAEGCKEVRDRVRKILCHQAAPKFDPETLERLANHLEQISDMDLLLDICGRFYENETGAGLLEYLDGPSG